MPPRSSLASRRSRLVLVALLLLLAPLAIATPAVAENAATPWWHVSSTAAPTNLPPGGEGQIYVTAIDIGDGPVTATGSNKVTVTDELPAGLEAIPNPAPPPPEELAQNVQGFAGTLLFTESTDFKPGPVTCELVTTRIVTCTFSGPKPLLPFVPLEVFINVKVKVAGPPPLPSEENEVNEVTITGGGAPKVSVKQPLTFSAAKTSFATKGFEVAAENDDGSPDTQAGSHPFQVTTAFALNDLFIENPGVSLRNKFPRVPSSVAETKDLVVKLPAGLVGNATTLPQCSEADFTREKGFTNHCPADTAVGVASATLDEPEAPPFDTSGGVATATVPVFNLAPAAGEPARFGFDAYSTFVTLDTSVQTGEDYAVVTSASNTTEIAALLASEVTLWGVPSDARHNQSRGWGCLAAEPEPSPSCASLGQSRPAPFLTLPGSCIEPLHSQLRADSWTEPGIWKEEPYSSPTLTGCNQLPFTPSISVAPETQAGSTPSGLSVNVHLPQEPSSIASAVAEANVKDTTVTLPQGVLLNPAASHGLQACSEAEIGFTGLGEFEKAETALFTPTLPKPFCPEASKVGTVSIRTPLLAHELTGGVYVAQQEANPFNSLIALYIVAEDPISGVLVKLAGKVTPDENTGQVITTFKSTPQTPFEDLKMKFFGGPTASLTTPAYCGTYTTTATFTPWSGTAPVEAPSPFQTSSGCTPPGGALPFAPSFQAGSTNNSAADFTPFTLAIGNPDGDQGLQGLTMKLPTGLAAVLASVTPCQEPQVANNTCGPESLIGHSVAYSGLGGDPYALPGQVFLTGPYKGAPFGLSVVTPAIAGPFNLGDVRVRQTINVDPTTAAVTITSDPFPQFIRGIPSQIKEITATVDRPNFQFNPTNCNAMAISATLFGAQGGAAAVSTPFHVANCANLPFKPKLTATAGGRGSKLNGANLNVKITSAGLGQANIAKVALQLPIALPSRLTTIQKACLAKVFEANPATCDEGSNIGFATVHTPVLKSPLSGPAYLVSHGNAAFPDVEFVLQGEGIKLILDGKTDIKKGITYSRFETNPDAPFTTFETVLPTGPHSALTANVPEKAHFSLCGVKLTMPTVITGQNGAVINQSTNIAVTGCAKPKATRAQLLAQALKACGKKAKSKRAQCARAARRKYATTASKKKKK
jgi:hypothetical protein